MKTTDTQFSQLAIGDTFDWISNPSVGSPSFFEPCRKTSTRCYVALNADGSVNPRYGTMRVGSVKARVYHVGGAQ